MNCKTAKTLLSEFADECLDAATEWQVQTHLSECASCTQISRDFAAMRRTLQTLPARQPSANFDAALAQRLALTRMPAKRQTWPDKLRLALPRPTLFLRPAFALGVAISAVTAFIFLPAHLTSSVPTQAVTRTADHAFVADCVAQHRRDAAGEPLADVAAQNLAGNLDSTALTNGSTPPSSVSGDSDVF